MEILSRSEFARRAGVTLEAISQAVKAGTITATSKGIPENQLEIYVELKKVNDAERETDGNLTYWRTRKAKAEALITEKKLAQTTGELVEKSEIEKQLAGILIGLRNNLENLPQRTAAVIASQIHSGQPDVEREEIIRLALSDEINIALSEVSKL